MKLDNLEKSVRDHSGEFLCVQIRDEKNTKIVRFGHVVEPASKEDDLPEIGRLRDFYETFGSIAFYHDEQSSDAARYIAPPSEWDELQACFGGWVDGLDEVERSEIVPKWIDTCIVIGETPQSGNYILMATQDPIAGHVFEFDHDGFEFVHAACDVVEYVEKLLEPDSSKLTEMASHMRFVEDDPEVQWWIREFRDSHGHVVATTS